MTTNCTPTQALGAYGLVVAGQPTMAPRLNVLESTAAAWNLVLQPVSIPPDQEAEALAEPAHEDLAVTALELTADTARAEFSLGALELDRPTTTATLRHHRPIDFERLAHPALAGVGAIAAHWAGRAALHAGAVVIDGRAWGILAGRSHGKSTTLAALETAGYPVLTDDLLVIDAQLNAHAGPRCVDLREESAPLFPAALRLDPVPGQRARFRLTTGPVPAQVPLAGFLTLAWANELGLQPVKPADRLAVIGSAASLRGVPLSPRLVLGLAALPSLILHRPQRLDALNPTIELVASLRSDGPSLLA